MEYKKRFDVEFLPQAREFLLSLDIKAKQKIISNIRKSQGIKDEELFKKISDEGIWEFRTEYNSVRYRLFAFWDETKKAFVIATHGIIKKTSTVPTKEIKKALDIRKQYYKEK